MDTIAAAAVSIDNPLLTAAGLVLDSSLIYAAIVLALLLIGESRNEKRIKVAASLLLTFLAVAGIKYALAQERPCAGEDWCPESYSFPSTHAAIAFTLMTGFLNKKSYAFYLLFALFVSFTRLNLGVHVFIDIAGALPVALLSYYFTDIVWMERDERPGAGKRKMGGGDRKPGAGNPSGDARGA
jgi:membrane-associated phospholipid phosphatase